MKHIDFLMICRHRMFQSFRPGGSLVLALVALFWIAFPADAEVRIQELVSQSGVKAWLVEDYTVPIITIRFAFAGGSSQDPDGKAGLANLMSGLFDEGAADLDNDAFQDRLDDAAAEMSFSAERDSISGSMRLLTDKQDEAIELLRMAINEPRFDPEPVERIRGQILTQIKSRQRDPDKIAEITWARELYGNHPYALQSEGTPESLQAITVDDLKAFHQGMFSRGNVYVGIVGAIDAAGAADLLDRLFASLPAEAELKAIERANPVFDQNIRVDYDLPQTTIRLAYPGIERSDPEFFAAYLMNHILGGGSFSSRLYDEIREKRGLAYGVGSYLINRDHASLLLVSTATRSDRAQETLDIIDEQIALMANEGPTEAELEAAKMFIRGAYAINNFDSSSDIARTLVGLQEENLGMDYISRRGALIDAVTLDDVKAVAGELLKASPVVMLVGPNASGDED